MSPRNRDSKRFMPLPVRMSFMAPPMLEDSFDVYEDSKLAYQDDDIKDCPDTAPPGWAEP